MSLLLQTAMIVLILTDLAFLATNRLPALVRLTAQQGAILALAALIPTPGGHIAPHAVPLAVAVFAIKGVGFPWLLARTLHRVKVPAAVEPYLGYNLSILAGIAGLVFSLWIEARLPVPLGLFPPMLFAAGLTTIFTGLILVTSRKKALTQVIGYLVAENGIFLLGAPLAGQGSVWVELSILLDVFVAVFVMGIALHHINKTFDTIDLGRFCTLRD